MKRLALKALLAISCGALGATAIAQDKPMVAGVDGTFAPHAMPKLGGGVEGFNVDLIMEIGKQLGRKMEIHAAEFSGLIPAMNAGRLDFVGAPTTVTPERAQNLLFTEGYLNTYYQFLVPAGKPDLKSLDDLKGKNLGLVDPNSTSGNNVPRFLLNNLKINPDSYFGRVVYTGSHENALLALQQKTVDVAANWWNADNDSNLTRMVTKGLLKKEDFRIVAKSDLIPNSPYGYLANLPADLKTAIAKEIGRAHV